MVRQKTQQWMHHVSWWLTSFNKPVYVLVFEKLVLSPETEVYKLFKFLDYPVTLRDMVCLRDNKDSPFDTDKSYWMTHDNLFMPATTSIIKDAVARLQPLFQEYNIDDNILQSYHRFSEDI